MLKKILIISISFFILAVLVTGYILFFRKSSNPSIQQTSLPLGGDATGTLSTSGAPEHQQDENGNDIIPVQPLMNLSNEPVAGAFVIETSTSTIVRYDLRATGHVTDVNLLTGTTSKVSNTTIPKIYESLWFNNGTHTLIRYLDDTNQSITTYNAAVVQPLASSTTETGSLTGTFMESNIASVALSPTKKDFFYLLEDAHGGRGYISANGGNASVAFDSPLSEWLPQWPESSTIALTTKPTYGISGYLYFLNTKTHALRKIMGDVPGLTTLVNPTAELVAYADNELNLSIYNTKTGTAVATNVKTLPEKCIWSQKDTNIIYCAVPSNAIGTNFPDIWYQGITSFADEIYRINTKTKQFEVVSTLSQSYTNPLDIIKPILSKNDNYIIFTNKIDGTLWSLHLTQ